MTTAPAASADAGRSFVETLRERIDAELAARGLTRFDDGRFRVKSAVVLLLFVTNYVVLLTVRLPAWGTLLVAMCWGLTSALVGFNVPHEGSHANVSPDPRVNRWFLRVFNLIGLDSYLWRLKHNVAHHGFTNVPGYDKDIEAWPLLRFSPADRPLFFHRYQHLYAPLAYLFLGPFIVLWVDFEGFFDRGFQRRFNIEHPRRQLVILFLTKLFFITYAFVIPVVVLPFTPLQVLFGLWAMLSVVGLVSGIALLPAHLMEFARFYPPRRPGTRRDEAAIRQIEATLDFSPESRVASFLLGGFNTNALHHLFPNICHVHSPMLTPILRATCAEFGVDYHSLTAFEAVRSHFRFLRKMGRGDYDADYAARCATPETS